MPLNSVQFELGGSKWTIETGELAKQATSSVVVKVNDAVILVTLVAAEKDIESDDIQDFLPLTVDYKEKTYAVGKFPGGFFKREGRPSDQATLTSRLIDRPLRSLFPKGFVHELQVFATVLSLDEETIPDVVAMVGASAAVAISDVKYEGPFAGCRIGMKDGKFIINPTRLEMDDSKLDLIVALNKQGIIMVESGSSEIDEETYINALEFAKEQSKVVIDKIAELQEKAGVNKKDYLLLKAKEEHVKLLAGKYENELKEAFYIKLKQERNRALDKLQEKITKELCLGENGEQKEGAPTVREIKLAYAQFEKEFCRREALEGRRQDGRGADDIRPITIRNGLLPRAHGSALFTRGETQALVATTLGTVDDEQIVDELIQYRKSFLLHYNFPPFSTGEVKPLRGPGRREIGHGSLAERALRPMIPSSEEFSYTIRVVSEILESNGSSSMATVCGGSLSMMDAGVPLKSPVAGIAMGLIKSPDSVVVLTDILGSEDALGDMDFKVAGTLEGITALQMDLKTPGISKEILTQALDKAKKARLFILGKMNEVISETGALSKHAPKVVNVPIKQDQIGRLIGPGGKVIREITSRTGAQISIDEAKGKVVIMSPDEEKLNNAKSDVESVLNGLKVGNIYDSKVVDIKDFGLIVAVVPTMDEGVVHISEICDSYVKEIRKTAKVGDKFKVKLFMMDDMGRRRFSIKRADADLGINQVEVPAEDKEAPTK